LIHLVFRWSLKIEKIDFGDLVAKNYLHMANQLSSHNGTEDDQGYINRARQQPQAIQIIHRVDGFIERLNACCTPVVDVQQTFEELSSTVILEKIPLEPASLRRLLRLARDAICNAKLQSTSEQQPNAIAQAIQKEVWKIQKEEDFPWPKVSFSDDVVIHVLPDDGIPSNRRPVVRRSNSKGSINNDEDR
jgi:hypothetical protein